MNAAERFAAVGRLATDDEWTAVSGRRAARPFLFLVTSTGILCTPGCPARTPGRDRIRVVAGPADALAAGARACLRCRPDRLFGFETNGPATGAATGAASGAATATGAATGAASGAATATGAATGAASGAATVDPVEDATARIAAALDAGDDLPTDRELAGPLGLTERRLREMFRERLGVTPRAWAVARRAELLRSRLAGGQPVLPALFDAGYGSASAAYEAANGELGMAPGRYRTGAAGESIRWTIAPIPQGVALVAATERGLCSILMGHETEALATELRAEFPRAALARDDAALTAVAGIVSDLAAGRRRPEADALPLDVHATAFRRRVWEALRRIPAGETRSYGEVAAAVGAPRAARAVGTACATNPVPIVVPCHRVVGAHGSLGGYAGGLARKRQLLDAEAEAVGATAGGTMARRETVRAGRDG